MNGLKRTQTHKNEWEAERERERFEQKTNSKPIRKLSKKWVSSGMQKDLNHMR